MFQQFIAWVKRLFGKTPMRESDAARASRDKAAYEDLEEVNVTAIFAGKLTNIAIADATLDTTDAHDGESQRSTFIGGALQAVWEHNHKITAQVLGKGGKVIVPYISNGRAAFDIVDQDRLYIERVEGDQVMSAALLAEATEQNGTTYYRWTDYMLENHTHIIRQRATDDSGREVPLKNIRTWAELPDEIRIDNVDRLLFAHLKSPVDNRKDKGLYGVPLTYGSERLVAEIQEHLKIIAREYKLTRPMLGLDSRLWSSPLGFGGAASPNGSPTSIGDVRKSVQDGDDPFIPVDNYYDEGKTPWLVYSPPIRDSAMYKRLDELFALLEKSVGTSRGILTARETANATATEIRSANHDTYTIITAIRKAWESALDDLAYAYDVYAEYFGLTPMGARDDYAIKLDWDMSLFESSSETFQQYIELLSQGVVSKPEVRQWMRGESLEDAERAIAAISEREGNGIIDRLLSAGEE